MAGRMVRSKTVAGKITRPVIRISVWAIALGVVIMIIALATGNGLRKEIRNKVTGFGGHIQILHYQPNPTHDQQPISLDDSLREQLLQRPQVTHIQAFGRKAGILKSGDLFEGAILKGVGPEYDWDRLQAYLREGRFPQMRPEGYNDSVVISRTLSQRLELGLNEQIHMYFVRGEGRPPLLRKFYIAGIYQTDFDEIDQNFLLGDLRHVQRLNRWEEHQHGGYEIFLPETGASEAEAREIRTRIPLDADALTARQMHSQLFQWLDLFDINILIILLIMVAVATINMSIALLILILERTRMIGILKALGSTNRSIQRMFLVQAGYLILRGLFWGNAVGLGLCLLQQQFQLIELDPATYYVSAVAVDLNPWPILGLNLGTMGVCLLCLWLPSFLITRISPVRAIRFD